MILMIANNLLQRFQSRWLQKGSTRQKGGPFLIHVQNIILLLIRHFSNPIVACGTSTIDKHSGWLLRRTTSLLHQGLCLLRIGDVESDNTRQRIRQRRVHTSSYDLSIPAVFTSAKTTWPCAAAKAVLTRNEKSGKKQIFIVSEKGLTILTFKISEYFGRRSTRVKSQQSWESHLQHQYKSRSLLLWLSCVLDS